MANPDPARSRFGLRWQALGVLALALFMASLDNTILNVALPTLARDLNAGMEELQWTVDAYQVTFAGTLLVAGALVDRWGRSRTFLVGTLAFGAFSLVAGLVSTTGMLIAARALMGIAAALLTPATLALVSVLFTNRRERSTAFALWSLANGAGGAAGPLLSGILLKHFFWGAIFLINVPIALMVALTGLVLLPRGEPRQSTEHVDITGGLASIISLALLCWAVISGPGMGIASILVWASLLAGALTTVFFLWWESRTPQPILRLGLFTQRRFSVAVAVGGIVTAGGAGALFVVSQYLQYVLRYTPLETGVRVLPVAGAMVIGALGAPWLISWWQLKFTVVGGLASAMTGFLIMAGLGVTSPFTQALPGLVFFGLGAGILVPAATQAVMDSVPTDSTGVGSATNTAMMQVGSALGVALIGAVLSARYRQRIQQTAVWDELGPHQDRALESMAGAAHVADQVAAATGEQLLSAANEAFMVGMRTSMLVSALALGLALLAVILFYPGDRRG